MPKSERVSRAAKRTGSQKAREKARQKVRQGSQVKAKPRRGSRKVARRATIFKSTSWYQTAAQSIGISPRAAP